METGAKVGMRDRSGGGSLFAFVVSGLSGLGGGGHARGFRRRRGLGEKRGSSEAGVGGDPSGGGHALPQLVKMTKCCGEREGRDLAHGGGG